MYFDVLLACLVFLNLGCFLACLLYILKNFIPDWMHDIFEYGKTTSTVKRSSWTRVFLVPNSWFTHFYLVGSSLSCAFLWLLVYHCLCENVLDSIHVSQVLGLRFTPSVDCFTVLVSLVLLLVQTCRRLFECLFVSVFTGKIHISHYLVGVVFYILDTAAVAVPFFKAERIDQDWCYSCKHPQVAFRWSHFLAVVVFTWASSHQWKCHNILAKLRHLPSGETTKVHRIPFGDWFEFVSCPHYLAEIIIYLSFFVLQEGRNIYIGLILVFTIQNLLLVATVTHEWYKTKFKDYPTSRYRIFPLVY